MDFTGSILIATEYKGKIGYHPKIFSAAQSVKIVSAFSNGYCTQGNKIPYTMSNEILYSRSILLLNIWIFVIIKMTGKIFPLWDIGQFLAWRNMRLQGNVAVITGVGSGIGRAITLIVCQRRCPNRRWDWNEKTLEEWSKKSGQPAARSPGQKLSGQQLTF